MVVGLYIVEIAEPTHDVAEGILGMVRQEAGHKQLESLLHRASGALFDGHQVEVVPQLAAVGDDFEFHGEQVVKFGYRQSGYLDGLRQQSLRRNLVRVKKLNLGSGEERIQGSGGAR